MPSLPRRVSQGLATGFAAILALLLSALGGVRLGLDRGFADDGDDERPAVVCRLVEPASLVAAPGETRSAAAVAARAPLPSHGRPAPSAAPALATVPAPGPRQGAANGPRAP
jgi:hypothetical protein